MLNKFKGILALALVLTLVPVGTGIYAEESGQEAVVETVDNVEELLQALADKDEVITLGASFNVTEPIVIDYEVTIDGAGHTISGNSTEGIWESLYIVHVYRTTATLKNITLTNGDAGLLVNGSTVTLEGKVDVSGNDFGGIEVSQGSGVTEPAILNISGTITNTTEVEGKPTIWLDNLTEGFNGEGFEKVVMADKNQVHFYFKKDVEPVTVEVASVEDLKTAIAANAPHITLTDNITVTEKINILHAIVIDGAGHTISGNNQPGWEGLYALQFYNVNATVKDLNFTNLDAAILVNGSTLTLEGSVNLSGNEFGGIELTQGVDVVNAPKLNIENVILTNTTEDYGQPTVWTDSTSAAEIIGGSLIVRNDINGTQDQYYLNAETAKEVKATKMFYEMFAALNSDKVKVNVNDVDGSLQVVFIGGKADVDAVVDVLTSIIVDNDEVVGFQIGNQGIGFSVKPSEEQIRTQVKNLVEAFLSSARTVAEVEGRAIPFALEMNIDGTDVKSAVANVSFTSRDGGTDPVEPVKPTEDKDTPKEDSKTPKTGIQDTVTMYASLIVMGALVLVALKSRKRYN